MDAVFQGGKKKNTLFTLQKRTGLRRSSSKLIPLSLKLYTLLKFNQLDLYVRDLLNNIAYNMKSIRRKYQPKGTRRAYKSMRIDIEVHEQLQELAEMWKTSIIQVIARLASEAKKTKPKGVE